MRLGTVGYHADLFGGLLCSGVLCAIAMVEGPWLGRVEWTIWLVTGVGLWTLAEYGVHRWLYHGVAFFIRLHDAHHSEPHAYIGAPPMLGVALIFGLIYLPAASISWLMASGLTTGMLLGYMGYQVVHHATHFWHASRGSYLYRARLHHSAHHYHHKLGNFGITTALWDQVFGTAVEVRRPGRKDPLQTFEAHKTV
jgi:sterol desaturase/sphingolipid hydroxylase (fatty acid hydroxylase superfamily)